MGHYGSGGRSGGDYRDELQAALARCEALEAEVQELRRSGGRARAAELLHDRETLLRELEVTQARLDDAENRLRLLGDGCPVCARRFAEGTGSGTSGEAASEPERFVRAALAALAIADGEWLAAHAEPELVERAGRLALQFAGGARVIGGRRDGMSWLDDWEFLVETRHAGRWQLLFNRRRAAPRQDYHLYFLRKID